MIWVFKNCAVALYFEITNTSIDTKQQHGLYKKQKDWHSAGCGKLCIQVLLTYNSTLMSGQNGPYFADNIYEKISHVWKLLHFDPNWIGSYNGFIDNYLEDWFK